MTPKSQLDLRELLAKATPGPWEARKYLGDADNYFVRGPSAERVCGQGSGPVRETNAALIVALRNGADELLDEVERLRAHIAEQIQHVEQRIQDGIEMGATVWRIALEDVARENRASLHPKQERDDATR